jgi:hypothetical protein
MYYFQRTYTTTVSGAATKHLRCANCHSGFSYDMHFMAAGRDHSPYGLRNAAAQSGATKLAWLSLERRRASVLTEVRPVHCPVCGFYQPDMLRLLPRELDPNLWAAFRVRMTPEETWKIACEANTIRAFENFMGIWPTEAKLAKAKIRRLKHRQIYRVIDWPHWYKLYIAIIGFIVVFLIWLANLGLPLRH